MSGLTRVVEQAKASALRSAGRVRDNARRRAADHVSERYHRAGILDPTVRVQYGTFIEGRTKVGAYTTFTGPPRIRGGEGELSIGRYCAIGVSFSALTSNHDMRRASTHYRPARLLGLDLPVETRGTSVIGNGVWIGDRVTVLAGARVGDGAVIGAGSIVTGEIPPFAIAVGSPCRVVRMRFSDEMIAALLRVAWWNWTDEEIEANRRLFELDLTVADPADVIAFAGGPHQNHPGIAEAGTRQ